MEEIYHREDPKDCNGVYIREKEIALAQKLAQKDYDKKVLSSIEKELNAINKYFSCYPDFTLLNIRTRKEILWEHFGMMDDPEYVEKAVQKIMTYEQNEIFQGENLILTYETRKIPLNQKTIMRKLWQYLK